MKHNKFFSYAILGSYVLLAAACVEEVTTNEEKYRPVGTPIVFSASTSYENGIDTRAEYSGELFGTSPKYERIDWEEGDPIHVVYNGNGSDYSVTSGSITPSNEISYADLTGNTLTWDGSGNHVFYALYPSGGNANGVLTTAGKVSGEIPTRQNVDPNHTLTVEGQNYFKYQPNTQKYGYMAAYENITEASDEYSVKLRFRPAFTTFEFKLDRPAGSPDKKVASFEMKTEDLGNGPIPLYGKFSLQINGNNGRGATWAEPSVTDGGNTITVAFPTGGVSIPEKNSGYLDFSVLALPIDLYGIVLTLNYVDGTHKSLKLKDNITGNGRWHTFTGAKKYILTTTAPGDSEWVYTLTEVDPTTDEPINVTDMIVDTPATGHGGHIGHYPAQSLTKPFKSYKTKVDDSSVNELVDVTIEYSPAKADGTCANNWSSSLPSWLSAYDVTSQPAQTAPTDTWMSQADFTQVNCDMTVTFNEIESSKARIQALSARSQFTSAAPQDLALYDIDKLNSSPRASGKPKTANCYVADRKGWYMFPLVYGNAIDWDWAPDNGWNTFSWKDNTTGDHTFDNYHMAHFQNYLAGWISSPYILDDVNLTVDDVEAVIVWEDASTPFISETETSVKIFNPYTESTTKYVAEDGTTKKVVPYIRFQVNDNIMQGNALIALREKTGSKRIIWSWHIWVTDLDMSTLNVPQRGGVVSSNDMMRYNLGWCDMRIGRKYSYVPRVYYVRISHDDPASNCEPLVFQVAESLEPYYTITQSSGTFYQLLRKDPFLPGTSNEGLTWGDLVSVGPNYSNDELQVAPHTPGLPRYINKPVYAPHSDYTITGTSAGLINTESVTAAQNDMRHAIQNPYIYYRFNDNTTMTWLYNSRPWNLWSMFIYRDCYNHGNLQWNANGSEIDYSPDYRYDLIVCKTIYDPCPPGFSVPNYAAFTGFTTSGTDLSWRDTGGAVHDFNPPVTWVPADAEHFFDIELYGDYRWYFGTTEGTPIVFAGSGYRSAGQVAGLFGGLYVPTVQKKGDRYVICLSGWGPVGAGNSRATAYGVRAIKEQPRPANLGARVGGQNVLVNDYSGNNWN